MSDTSFRPSSSVRPNVFADARAEQPNNSTDVRADVSGVERFALRAIPTWLDGGVQTSHGTDESPRAISSGRRLASGGGGADGYTLREACGRGDLERPNFDIDVPAGGYAWWYIDGVSDDGLRAVSIIGFIGSVFSPWYHWSGRGNPANNCCINVATYGPQGRFAMTDRGENALRRSKDVLTVGPSKMAWQDGQLVIDISELSSLPLISRMRGQIRVMPSAVTSVELPLTTDGAHVWRPFAPTARISVNLEAKGWQFDGHGYFDSNFGTRPLEHDFSYWTWGRFPTQDGSTCFYDADRRDGTRLEASIAFDKNGLASLVDAPPRTPFKRTMWALRRETRADAGVIPRQIKPMLDAPFYSRSIVETQVNGEVVRGVHEALDLKRYGQPLLKPMLAMRVPRRTKWKF